MRINKEILRLAIPNILSNISVPLIASVDTSLMGFTSVRHLAAVGSATVIFNFLYWNFGFLRMGTTGLVAQAHGAQDTYEKSRIFFQSSMIALVLSAFLIIFQSAIGNISMDFMNLEGDSRALASSYFNIRIWDAPATILLYVLMAWFFGNQNSIIPFVLTLLINVVNIGLSILFVRQYNMGIEGVALGSVIGNYAGVSLGLFFVVYQKKLVKVEWSSLFNNIKKYVQINRDIFLRTLLLSITFAFLYSQAGTYGVVMLSVTVVLIQFLHWMSYAIDGFAYASEALVGKYKGAEDIPNLRESIKISMIWGFGLAVIFGLVYVFGFEKISSLFTDDQEVLMALQKYKYWMGVIPLIAWVSYMWDGVFIGLTASRAMLHSMFISFVLYLSTYYLLKDKMGFDALLIALVVYLAARGIVQTYQYWNAGFELK